MQMLHSAAQKAAQLAADGHDMSSFEATCASIRRRLDETAAARALGIAQQLELPCREAGSSAGSSGSGGSSSSKSGRSRSSKSSGGSGGMSTLEEEQGRCRLPRGIIPSALQPDAGEGGLSAARQRAAASLGLLPLLPEGSAPSVILAWLKDPLLAAAESEVSLQLRLHSVERELFCRCVCVGSRSLACGIVKQGAQGQTR